MNKAISRFVIVLSHSYSASCNRLNCLYPNSVAFWNIKSFVSEATHPVPFKAFEIVLRDNPNASAIVSDMKYDMVYPNVFMSQEDAEAVARYETDIKQYAEQKKADWILNGGVEDQWDEYIQKLNDLGLEKYLEIKQKYLDDYLAK